MRKRSEAKEPDPLDGDPTHKDGETPSTSLARDPEPTRKRYDFKSAHARTSKDADLREDLVNIVETVWVDDMHASWKRIKAALQPIGVRRSEHGMLMKRLDEARAISYEAHCLYVTAKREYDRWELENEVTNSAMWIEATREVEQERVDKVRTKPITDGDIRAKIMALHADEHIHQETKRRAVKLTVENMTHLVKEANEVVEDYRIMLAKLRS